MANTACSVQLPLTPEQLHGQYPINHQQATFIAAARAAVCRQLDGHDERLLLIVGPCSIHDIEAALDYAKRLQQLAKRVAPTLMVVMRVYFEKPRTALGWRGYAADPHLDGSYDFHTGATRMRQLLLHIADLKIPVAAEFLEPLSLHYFGDLVTWGCIGARTVESPLHRQMASGMAMPIAFKNTTAGSVQAAINAIIVASSPHTFITIDHGGSLAQISTRGNSYGHLVLRGGSLPNSDRHSVETALKQLAAAGLPSRLLIDCSHGNSGHDYRLQPQIFQQVIEQAAAGNSAIRGMLIEGHIHEGSQPFTPAASLRYGVSITDGCLGWETTEALIIEADRWICRCGS
jgi:3-deoxy-7-phosphoheptulonate synthase